LTTEEFYNSPMRVQKTEEAKQRLNSELNLKGIEVDQVLVRYFIYSKEIQKNIEAKKLQDQMVFTNQAAARAAKEEAELKKIVQEGMVIAAVELEKGKAYVTRKIAEKDLYVRDVIILPSDGPDGVNPLNLDNALQLFDVRKGGGK
jgi:regulator of protease activity HflC (stomatin/prohibitin superfamily)